MGTAENEARRGFLHNLLVSDEATFDVEGNVNKQNCRYWSEAPPQWVREREQHPAAVIVRSRLRCSPQRFVHYQTDTDCAFGDVVDTLMVSFVDEFLRICPSGVKAVCNENFGNFNFF